MLLGSFISAGPPPNEALQLTAHRLVQPSRGTVRQRAPAPPRYRSARCGAAERPVRQAAPSDSRGISHDRRGTPSPANEGARRLELLAFRQRRSDSKPPRLSPAVSLPRVGDSAGCGIGSSAERNASSQIRESLSVGSRAIDGPGPTRTPRLPRVGGGLIPPLGSVSTEGLLTGPAENAANSSGAV